MAQSGVKQTAPSGTRRQRLYRAFLPAVIAAADTSCMRYTVEISSLVTINLTAPSDDDARTQALESLQFAIDEIGQADSDPACWAEGWAEVLRVAEVGETDDDRELDHAFDTALARDHDDGIVHPIWDGDQYVGPAPAAARTEVRGEHNHPTRPCDAN